MNVVPLMARIVLAAAFIPAGADKLFNDAQFTEAQAKRLNELGVATTPVLKPTTWLRPQTQIVLASATSESSNGSETWTPWVMAAALDPAAEEEPSPPARGEQTKPGDLVDDSKVDAPKPAPTESTPPPASTGPMHTARALHHITLMVDEIGLPYQVAHAWLAGLTEFIGGILILIGFLSRLCGLGLAGVMAMAFYLTSLDKIDSYFRMEDLGQFNTLFCQLGLFVLAFGVFLTGPGRLSLDRMLFGRSTPPQQPIVPVPNPRPM
jgi:uncharacterized membrane protein YphA (DoxX/SURF4 family)